MTGSDGEEYEAEATDRVARTIAPQLQTIFQAMGKHYSASISKAISDVKFPHQRAIQDLIRINLPTLKFDYGPVFGAIAASQAGPNILRKMQPAFARINQLQREQLAGFIETARQAVEASLPPNWSLDSIPLPNNLDAMLLDEGLPLAWVPPTDTVSLLFAADTGADRRRIIGRRWKSITNACAAELTQVEDADLVDHAHFAGCAAEALLKGSHEASQALSANLLDSILYANFTTSSRLLVSSRDNRPGTDDFPLRIWLVLAGIWGSYGRYRPSDGDPIPRTFSRHGSAHGVSRRQYSRLNAVIALMHVVSLLRLLETEFNSNP